MKTFVLLAATLLATMSHAETRLAKAAEYAGALKSTAPDSACIAIAYFNQSGSEQHFAGTCNEDSIFQIGSISKTFTGLLLANAVKEKRVSLDTPIADLLETPVPGSKKNPIRLRHLATHTSGLPRLPDNLDLTAEQMDDPYAAYNESLLLAFLASHTLVNETGAHSEYSNLATGLLGYLLANQAQTSYGELVAQVIAGPLKLADTTQTLSTSQRQRALPGHRSGDFAQVPNWTFDTLAGAGALNSTLSDMTAYTRATMNNQSPLDDALTLAKQKHADFTGSDQGIGLGWIRQTIGDNLALWHNGGTAGHRSFAGYVPDTGEGVVVLANAVFPEIDAIGTYLLGGAALPALANAEAAQGSEFEAYVGRYPLTAEFVITISSDGDTLFGQATGQPRFTMKNKSTDRYAIRGVDAEIEFLRAKDGTVEALVLYQNGAAQKARKEGVARETVTVDEATLERYVGQYQLAPGAVITVTRKGTQLEAQLTGQPAFPVYPSSPTRFYYEVVEAELEFHEQNGQITGLTLHQNGQHKAPKTK